MAFTTIEERLAAVERLLGLTDDAVTYTSNYSAEQIDEAVGRALPGGALDTGKAPAGFGLGEVTAKEITDANRAVESGYYQCSQNVPAPGWWYVHCISHYDGSKTQYAFSVPAASGILAGTVCKRYMNDGTWGEWEYINPPMQLGVEYRTTERYLGKPVYAKLVNFGALPNASNKSVAHNLASPLNMVDGKITDSNGSFVTNYNIKNFAISTANMIVETETDMSGVSAYILLKYTKTTD